MPYNPEVSYGRALLDSVQSQIPVFGNVFVVVSTSDSADPNYQKLADVVRTDTNGQVRLFTSLPDAYAAVSSNNNDVICLDAHSTHALTTGLAITKNRVHFLGMDGGRRMLQQGAKVELAGAVDSAYVIKNTGVRNTFRNIKFIQSSTHANALTCLQDGSEGSLYENCSFVFGVVNNLGGTTAHEVLAGSDSATFRECTFGSDTLLTSAARSVFHIDQVTASQEFKSNQLIDCTFSISSSSSTATFVRLDAVGDILFSNLFKRCTFLASVDSAGGAALAEASQTGTGTVKGCLAYDQCSAFNCTDFATATSGRNAATQVVGIVSTAGTSNVGVVPTA